MKNKLKFMQRRIITLFVLFSIYLILLLGGIFLYNWQSGSAETVYIIIISIIFPVYIGLRLIPDKDSRKVDRTFGKKNHYTTFDF